MSSLYALNFTLLPRPPRSVLSIGNEATRATLPDFANVDQLRSFVDRLHIYRLDVRGLFVHVKVGASFVCALVVVVMLIISRRCYEKSFWVVRVKVTSSGRVLVPNSMLIFALVEGIFGITFIVFLWLYCAWFDTDRSRPFDPRAAAHRPVNPVLWLGVTWTPLITGALWASVGMYWAKPSVSIDTGHLQRSWKVRLASHAITINTLGILCPLLISAAVVAPAIVSNRGYMRGLQAAEQWHATYGRQTTFTQAMVQDAQRIWFKAIEAHRLTNVMFAIWSAFAVLQCALFSAVARRLIASIRSELQRRLNKPVRLLGIVTTHMLNPNVDKVEEERRTDVEMAFREVREAAGEVGVVNEMVVRPSVPVASHPCDDDDDDDEPARGHFRWMPNILMHRNANVTGPSTASRASQLRELRKAAVHICIQFAAITPACSVLAGIALMLAITPYGTVEQPSASGGTQFEHILAIALMWVTYTICLFGGVTLIAIASKTYESVFQGVHFPASDGSPATATNLHTASNSQRSSRRNRTAMFGRGGIASAPPITLSPPPSSHNPAHSMSTFFFETETTRSFFDANSIRDSVGHHRLSVMPPQQRNSSAASSQGGGLYIAGSDHGTAAARQATEALTNDDDDYFRGGTGRRGGGVGGGVKHRQTS